MSLPTYAIFFNKDDEVIAKHFVNVGWWMDADIFADAVLKLPWVNGTSYVELYGIRIDSEALPDYDKKKSWKEMRQSIIDTAPEVLKDFNQDSELRVALRNIYKNQNK